MATAMERYRNAIRDEGGHVINGQWFPGLPDKHEQIRNLPIRTDDIVIDCYPKSGTHWLYRIVTFINSDGDLDKVRHYPSIPMEVSPIGKENVSLELLVAAPSPRIITSHLPFELLPKGVQEGKCNKIILVIRNPKDVAVSHFYFHKKMLASGNFDNLTWEDFVEVFCEPDTLPYGSWFGHVKAWLKHRNDPNVLFVTYEDLQNDLPKSVFRVAEFLGRPVSGDCAAEIAKKCQFDNMKKEGESEGGQGALSVAVFLRKGIIGDWKSHFTVAQNEHFDAVYKREMKDVEINIQFER